jgi:hypothetical protein
MDLRTFQAFLTEFAEIQKSAASLGRLTIPKSRIGRRSMSVETLLRKDKDGTLYKEANPMLLSAITGGLAAYSPARNVAGETAAAIAPKGRVTRSENIARQLAIPGMAAGALGGLVLAHRYNLPVKLMTLAKGNITNDPHVAAQIGQLASPFLAAMGGGMAGGLVTGGATGLVQRIRGPLHEEKVKKAAAVTDQTSAVYQEVDPRNPTVRPSVLFSRGDVPSRDDLPGHTKREMRNEQAGAVPLGRDLAPAFHGAG